MTLPVPFSTQAGRVMMFFWLLHAYSCAYRFALEFDACPGLEGKVHQAGKHAAVRFRRGLSARCAFTASFGERCTSAHTVNGCAGDCATGDNESDMIASTIAACRA